MYIRMYVLLLDENKDYASILGRHKFRPGWVSEFPLLDMVCIHSVEGLKVSRYVA